MRLFRGLSASPGIAIGQVLLLDRRRIHAPHYHIEDSQTDVEIQRLEKAIEQSVEQLESIRTSFVGEGLDHQPILEAHEMMLKDKALLEEASGLIRTEKLNAEWSVERVIERIRKIFDKVTDAYFKERRGDIYFVGERILRNLTGKEADIQNLEHVDEDTIVVAYDLSPVDTAMLAGYRLRAFVTEVGTYTAHTAIVARSLDIPAVVGVKGVMQAAGQGDAVVVDGVKGTVLLQPTSEELKEAQKGLELFEKQSLELLEAKALPAETLDGKRVEVAGNIELPSEVSSVLERGGEAIGLYRTEFLFLGRQDAPSEEEHFQTYCKILAEMGERKVTIRTLDVGGEKLFSSIASPMEHNPALGMRAVRYCLSHQDIFEAQIAGLLRASVFGELQIMLPMVSCLSEVHAVKQIIHDVEKRLEDEGKEFRKNIPFGITIEVPSAVLLADELIKECDFFSVGTNDLIQYLLAVDRNNEWVNYLYRPLSPAVLKALRIISSAAFKQGKDVYLCGEMAGMAECVPFLLGMGFDQLSMNAGSIPRIKRLVRELSFAECEDLLDSALECADATDVELLARDFIEAKISGFDSYLK
ncbi:MAG: phosphoenolpyruvate--protein phosphotransferase [Myxococcales bacterium]|nr:phosphoenolpyruvate--protein phosphotransferase [Myxococcales bacterium]